MKVGKTTLILLTEAERLFGVSRVTLWRAIKAGKLKGFRVGAQTFVRPEEVAKWKEKHYRADMAARARKRQQKA